MLKSILLEGQRVYEIGTFTSCTKQLKKYQCFSMYSNQMIQWAEIFIVDVKKVFLTLLSYWT